MEKQPILDAARSEMASTRGCLLIALGIVLLVFGLNHKYIYNVFTGPHDLKDVDLESPGMIRSVESKGEFVKVGSQETKRLGLETGGYYLHTVGDKIVLVEMDSDFSGSEVKGRLEKMDKKVEEVFGDSVDLPKYMVVARVSYFWGASLFMFGAMLAFPIILISLLLSLLKGGDPMKHAQIAGLKSWGEPRALVTEIESEITTGNATDGEQLVHSSAKWFVLLEGSLIILPQDQLERYGFSAKKELQLFVRGKSEPTNVVIDGEKYPQLVQQLDAAIPEKATPSST